MEAVVIAWFLYSGLFVFSLLGLVWLGQRNDIKKHELAVKRAQEIIIAHVRNRARRGY